MDDLDRALADALRINGRAPFARIADVLGVSEQTVARRYRRLRSAGILRVVGGVDGARLGYSSWTIRLRCTPDAATAIAAALARRPDTYWVHILSGGTEISCFIQAHTTEERDDALLLEKLPRTTRVLAMTAHAMLRGYAAPSGWSGIARLSAAQVEKLRPPQPEAATGTTELTDPDQALLEILARDGRAGHADLAAATGWSESTVRRRIDGLARAGILRYELDISPEALGFHAEARLWMTVRPTGLIAVAQAMANHPYVQFAAVTTGPTNLMVALACPDSDALFDCVTGEIGSFEDVQTLETAPLIRTVKRTGAVLPR
ncbi:Lrp/AsnC family transcriptional regulator [Fodinicola feengrottensis]|uniref:Lrp/AsnC family transcriptional regulator n=1 Tax=Fodinicola feengrottensis TaxID=435914 RepID=UPI002442E266|nr:Lrp/AsnC family transcriptional regulator [Fodinicola feengrottensis]